MGGCSICGDSQGIQYSCSYCTGRYCGDHRLPENHSCPGLPNATTLGPDLREDTERTWFGVTRGDIPLRTGLSRLARVPFNALTRTTSSLLARPFLVLALLAGSVIAAHLFGVVDLPVDAAMAGLSGLLSATGDTTTGTTDSTGLAGTPDSATSHPTDTPLNRSRIEHEIHREINTIRRNRGLPPLSWDDSLHTIARYHSRQMATENFFAHTSPSGQTMEDRYKKFGYYCEVTITGDRYSTGGENIAKTFHHRNVIGYGRLTTEQEVAEGLVEQWMDSDGHRENILKPYWNNEGIGVHLTADNAVYATQNFC